METVVMDPNAISKEESKMNVSYVGEGKVYLIAGGGRIYTDMAASFCRTEKDVEDIIASPENKKLLQAILSSNHKAAMEFDDYIFGVQGYARVTEVQLVRKRHASYMIKSGRVNKNGKRSYDVVLPKDIMNVAVDVPLDTTRIMFKEEDGPSTLSLYDLLMYVLHTDTLVYHDKVYYLQQDPTYEFDTLDLLHTLEKWYDHGVEIGKKEEELRYMKPQATEFKAMIKMNAAGLKDWLSIRLCNRAQTEIRDLATKMYKLCLEAHPDIFSTMGPSCKVLGYCPEGEQCAQMKGKVPTKAEALAILKERYQPTTISK